VKKDKDKPAPGDYDATAAFNKTQTKQLFTQIKKHKIKSFAEEFAYSKRQVPDPSAYNVTQKSFGILSKSPNRSKRCS